ncbi:MAG: hypothetical protein WAN35_01755 [Terracidiphilus sp.]
MDQIEELVDERQKSWCIHCGGCIAELDTNRDHVPSKSLLREPYPANLPVVEVCTGCNEGFSLDEEYLVVFLSCVLAGSTDPHQQRNPRVERILQNNSKLRARIEGSRKDYKTLGGKTRSVWTPELERVNRVIVKNARGHALFEYGEPMLRDPQSVWSAPLETLTTEQRRAFETIEMGDGWPEVGSRMLTRVMTGQDLTGSWVIVQDGIYRYAVAQQGVILVKSVLFEYLATEVFWGD